MSFHTLSPQVVKRSILNDFHIPVLLLACCLLFSCKTTGPDAGQIIVHARVWSDGGIREFDAIAIKGDRILATGSSEDIMKLKSGTTKVIDAGGRLLCPGFIDAHVHLLQAGFSLSSVQLRDANTPREFISRMAAFVKTVPAGSWIIGGDWNHELWGGELPSRHWIDSVTPEHPVAVNRLDGHMILCNSLAMERAGINRSVKAVVGGEIPRDAKGEILGIFKDNAADLVYAKIPNPPPALEDQALQKAMDYVASYGVTGVHHMGSFADLEIFRRNKDKLITRFYAATPLSQWAALKTYIDEQGRGDSILHWGMLKGFMDGSLGSHTAAMFEDFADKAGDKGLFVNPHDSMTAWIQAADRAGLHIGVHAIGDKAISDLIDIYEQVLDSMGARDRRWRIEHFQHPATRDLSRMRELGVTASMQPYHAIDDGCWAEKVIGKDRIQLTYAFRSVLDERVDLAFGSDWFVAPAIPVMGIYAAVTRQTLDGKNPGGWVPGQKISVDEALTAYTSGSARAGFEEQYTGSIRKGHLADLVLLEDDITTLPPDSIKTARVAWTMMGGRTVYSRE